MFEDSFIEVDPSSTREISSSWWDHILSGHLWFIDLDTFPMQVSVEDFRHLCYRRARQRGMNISVATSLPSRKVFVQRVPVRGAPTWPRAHAQLAPPVPKIKVLNYKAPVTPAPAWMPPFPPSWIAPSPPAAAPAAAPAAPPVKRSTIHPQLVKHLPADAIEALQQAGFAVGGAPTPEEVEERELAFEREQLAAMCTCGAGEGPRHQHWCLAAGGGGMPPAQPEELPWPTQPEPGQE